jgi:tetratricopeptide (TPR) repeat protein
MTNELIEKKFFKCCSLALSKRLKESFVLLGELIAKANIADLSSQLEELTITYNNLLNYTFRGVSDPQRDRIYKSLIVSTLELADIAKQKALVHSGMKIQILKQDIEKTIEKAREEAKRDITDFEFHQELSDIFLGNLRNGSIDHNSWQADQISSRVFNFIWLSDKYADTDIELIRSIRLSENLPWHQKSLVVSALTLSLLNCFDQNKFLLLTEFYLDREQGIWQRAFTGLFLSFYQYNSRITLYPKLLERLEAFADDERFGTDIERLYVQIIKALGTEKVTKKFREDILPDISKIESKLKEKLDLDNILPEEYMEDKNPNWELLFSDSPGLIEKIEQMSQMQMDGNDLFMGTFSMLKHFDFFRETTNWFLPFYRGNESLLSVLPKEEEFDSEAFLDGLENAFYMCDSDKYSFGFNIVNLPAEQRKFIAGMFGMEAGSLKDITDEDRLLNKPEADNYVFIQYIQDLYRFYKLNPNRAEFSDIFILSWDIHNSSFFKLAVPQPSIRLRLGEFLFEQEYFDHALGIFLEMLDKKETDQQDIYEKIAYCYQRKNNFLEAVNYYQKAELFGTNRMWNIKKIIYCYRSLKDSQNALLWCNEAAIIDPSDLYIHTQSAHSYLDLKEYDKALEHYFKVEFLAPDNKKVLRPIAWCSFTTGKIEIASNYSAAIMDSDPGVHDYINAGHLALCQGDKPKAITLYRKSFESKEISFDKFLSVFSHDQPYLILNGVDKNEIPLLLDYLREFAG